MYMEEESMDKIAFKDVIAEHLNRYQLNLPRAVKT